MRDPLAIEIETATLQALRKRELEIRSAQQKEFDKRVEYSRSRYDAHILSGIEPFDLLKFVRGQFSTIQENYSFCIDMRPYVHLVWECDASLRDSLRDEFIEYFKNTFIAAGIRNAKVYKPWGAGPDERYIKFKIPATIVFNLDIELGRKLSQAALEGRSSATGALVNRFYHTLKQRKDFASRSGYSIDYKHHILLSEIVYDDPIIRHPILQDFVQTVTTMLESQGCTVTVDKDLKYIDVIHPTPTLVSRAITRHEATLSGSSTVSTVVLSPPSTVSRLSGALTVYHAPSARLSEAEVTPSKRERLKALLHLV